MSIYGLTSSGFSLASAVFSPARVTLILSPERSSYPLGILSSRTRSGSRENSCAMMLRYSFGLGEEADCIEAAVEKALNDGHRTADIAKEGEKVLSTSEMGAIICENIKG